MDLSTKHLLSRLSIYLDNRDKGRKPLSAGLTREGQQIVLVTFLYLQGRENIFAIR